MFKNRLELIKNMTQNAYYAIFMCKYRYW